MSNDPVSIKVIHVDLSEGVVDKADDVFAEALKAQIEFIASCLNVPCKMLIFPRGLGKRNFNEPPGKQKFDLSVGIEHCAAQLMLMDDCEPWNISNVKKKRNLPYDNIKQKNKRKNRWCS